MKAYQITPSSDPSYDSDIIRAGDTWKPALDAIEDVLESLFLRAEAAGEPWASIPQVTVKCVEVTEEEMAELEGEPC